MWLECNFIFALNLFIFRRAGKKMKDERQYLIQFCQLKVDASEHIKQELKMLIDPALAGEVKQEEGKIEISSL